MRNHLLLLTASSLNAADFIPDDLGATQYVFDEILGGDRDARSRVVVTA